MFLHKSVSVITSFNILYLDTCKCGISFLHDCRIKSNVSLSFLRIVHVTYVFSNCRCDEQNKYEI